MEKVGFIEALQANKTKRVRRLCIGSEEPYKWQEVGEFQKVALGELDGVAINDEHLFSKYEIEEETYRIEGLTAEDVMFLARRCSEYSEKQFNSRNSDAEKKINYCDSVKVKIAGAIRES